MKFRKTAYKILLFFSAFAAFSTVVSARTLAEYKQSIRHVRTDTAELISSSFEDEAERKNFEERFFEELPGLLPRSEKIDIGGASIETRNDWLYEKIEHYKKSREPDALALQEASLLVLHEIYERLSSIENEISEYETARADDFTKDANKQKLSEILKREEYVKPEPPEESFLEKALRRLREWFNEMFPEPEIPKDSPAQGIGNLAFILQILLYAVIIGAIGFLLYKFLPFLFDKYKTREKTAKTERVILGEKIAADASAAGLFEEAEKLASDGNLRGAIRKGYIALLFELGERKIIGLSKSKTNRDYLRDARRSRKDLFDPLNGLTSNYERHWYGFSEANENDWNEFKNDYRRAVGEMK